MVYGARMGINGVRRSGITRAFAAVGFGMAAIVAVGIAAYAAVILAAVAVVIVLAVVISHPFVTPAPVAPVVDGHDDEAARAHRARVAAILGR